MNRLAIKKLVFITSLLLGLLLVSTGCQLFWVDKADKSNKELVLATTTSVYDSGLLEKLVADFEKKSGYRVKIIAVGSGEAIKMGERGDVDVLLVHSPEEEEKFMIEGFGKERKLVMFNSFILLGPFSDPARVKGLPVVEAFRLIAEKKKTFVSRADGSGTHQRELKIWEEAGVNPDGNWYLETGQGMGESLKIASEKGAYTLSDKGTFLALKNNLALQEITTQGSNLLNQYSVITVSPVTFPRVNYEGAKKFKDFLLSREVQAYIAEFGKKKYGEPLFKPAVNLR